MAKEMIWWACPVTRLSMVAREVAVDWKALICLSSSSFHWTKMSSNDLFFMVEGKVIVDGRVTSGVGLVPPLLSSRGMVH